MSKQKISRRCAGPGVCVIVGLVAVVSALPFTVLWAQGVPSDKAARALVDEIERAYRDFETGLRKDLEARRFENYAAISELVDGLAEKLAGRGLGAVATIKTAVSNTDLSLKTRRRLLVLLKNMPGKEIEEFILETGMEHPELYDVALNVLQARLREAGPLALMLTRENLETLSEVVLNGDERRAVQAATYLSIFESTPVESRLGPVITRFEREIGQWLSTSAEANVQKSDYYDFTLLSFLDVFQDFGPVSRSFLRTSMERNPRHQEARTWYFLALAATGDSAVGEEIRRLVDDNSADVRVRSEAVHLYHKILGASAIPHLERWSRDTTEVTNPMHSWKRFPVASRARLELRIAGVQGMD